MGTQYGKSSFGSLLLQDLMVVPLLVITPILAGKEVVFRTARSAGN
jgi:Kef-type K+ transport system membrane component KefB